MAERLLALSDFNSFASPSTLNAAVPLGYINSDEVYSNQQIEAAKRIWPTIIHNNQLTPEAFQITCRLCTLVPLLGGDALALSRALIRLHLYRDLLGRFNAL